MVHEGIVTQGMVADLRRAGLLNDIASLAPEKDRRRHVMGSTSTSSEDGVTGDEGRVTKNIYDIIEQVRAK